MNPLRFRALYRNVMLLLSPQVALELDLASSRFGSADRLTAPRGTGSLDNRGIPDGLRVADLLEELSIVSISV